MGTCSSVYGWAGGRRDPEPRPELSRSRHAKLLNESGAEMHEARVRSYERYCRECRAWGGEPLPERDWFMKANGAAMRLYHAKEKHQV